MPTSWPDPPLTRKEANELARIVEAAPIAAASMMDCSAGQAAALQRYVLLCCVVKMRERRGIPCSHERMQARTLMRCLPGIVRNQLPDAIRFAFQ
jgi:hypothetical protein